MTMTPWMLWDVSPLLKPQSFWYMDMMWTHFPVRLLTLNKQDILLCSRGII